MAADKDAGDVARRLQAGAASPADVSSAQEMGSAIDQWMQDFPWFADLCTSGQPEQEDAIAHQKTVGLMAKIQKNALALGLTDGAQRDAAILATKAGIGTTNR
jgi:hypothetical protein